MTELTDDEFNKLTRLCRIECSEAEKKNFQASVQNILTYAEQLNEIDTNDVNPCYTVLETLQNITREDEVTDILTREEFLSNAPAHVGGMVKVPPVIKFQK